VRISLIADRDRLGKALDRWRKAGIRYQPEEVLAPLSTN
jgi:LL-diaminopimelate aminotransferase